MRLSTHLGLWLAGLSVIFSGGMLASADGCAKENPPKKTKVVCVDMPKKDVHEC